jgi:putative peptidoglycan lipid II flippase
MDNPAVGFAIGVSVGGLIQLLFQIPFAKRFGLRFFSRIDWRYPLSGKVFGLIAPAVFGLGIYQINIIVGNSIASTLYAGSVSSLKFSNRLLELIIGIVVISLTTVLLPRYADLFLDGKTDKIKEDLNRSIRLLAFISIPITMGGCFLAGDIVLILFGRGKFDSHSVYLTSSAFQYHVPGLCFIAWNRVLLTCYQSAGCIKRTVQSGVFIIFIHLILALILSEFMGHNGIAAAASLSQILHTLTLVFFLRELSLNNVFSIRDIQGIIKSLLSGIIMILLILPIKHLLDTTVIPGIVNLLAIVVAGGIVYVVSSYLLKSRELKYITNAFVKKRSGIN